MTLKFMCVKPLSAQWRLTYADQAEIRVLEWPFGKYFSVGTMWINSAEDRD